ncbi:hypothetical protein [Dickeya oryzae]
MFVLTSLNTYVLPRLAGMGHRFIGGVARDWAMCSSVLAGARFKQKGYQ